MKFYKFELGSTSPKSKYTYTYDKKTYLSYKERWSSDKPSDYYQGKYIKLLEVIDKSALEGIEYAVGTIGVKDNHFFVESEYMAVSLSKSDLTELIKELTTIRDNLVVSEESE